MSKTAPIGGCGFKMKRHKYKVISFDNNVSSWHLYSCYVNTQLTTSFVPFWTGIYCPALLLWANLERVQQSAGPMQFSERDTEVLLSVFR